MKRKRLKNRKLLDSIKQQRCLLCGNQTDPCHIRSRGAGGDDDIFNVVPLCRFHHGEQHSIGWVGFLERYPMMELHLEKLGWELQTLFGKIKLVRQE